jgi:hypothetical protein
LRASPRSRSARTQAVSDVATADPDATVASSAALRVSGAFVDFVSLPLLVATPAPMTATTAEAIRIEPFVRAFIVDSFSR